MRPLYPDDVLSTPVAPGHEMLWGAALAPNNFAYCRCGEWSASGGAAEVVASHANHTIKVAAVMTPVPNKPKTPVRNFRIPEEIYGPARDRAAERGETVTDVVKRALVRYAKAKGGEK